MSEPTPLFRQWTLLRAIAAGNGETTVKSLVAATGMSDKTIRRDLAMLTKLGFPITQRTGEFGRKTFHLPTSDAPILQFTFDEALALFLCRRAADAFGGTYVEQSLIDAFRKIEASLGRRAAQYVATMVPRIERTQHANDYAAQAELLDRLFIGIEEDRAVFLTYRSQTATEPVTYDVHPYRLIEHRGSLYLFGHSPDHGECRTWKVDRMHHADLTDVRFTRPNEQQIAAQLSGSFGIFHGQGNVTVRIRFAPSVARYVSEQRMHPSQTYALQPDGSALVTFQLSNTTEVKSWILSFGANAEVIEPEALRGEIRAELTTLLSTLDGQLVHANRRRSAKIKR